MKIEFVSYDGKYPCLCIGTLTLNIDGKNTTFGMSADYPRFWISGGDIWFDEHWDEHVDTGAWLIDVDDLPDFLKSHANELIILFNENVEDGCCGGCI